MKIKDLEIFLDILNTKSPTISAENFYLTQPNISITIKNIEKMVGEKLFERVGKKLLPTQKAIILGNLWLEIIQNYHKSLELIGDEELLLGKIKIVATQSIGEYLLPSILFDFAKKNPKVKINLQIKNTKECLYDLKQGNSEIAFIEGELNEEKLKSENFEKTILCEDELIVATNNQKLASKKRYVDELLDQKWIFREQGSGLRAQFLKELADIAKKIPITLELDRTSVIKELVIKKNAISIFSKRAIEEELKNKILYKINLYNIHLKRNFCFVKRKSSKLNWTLEKFEDFLLKNIKG